MDLAADRTQFAVGTVLREVRAARRDVAYLRSARATTTRASYAPGTIPNNALRAATAAPGVIQVQQSGFALTTTPTTVTAASLVVPPGYTFCAVQVTGRVQAINSLGTDGWFATQITVNGVTSNALWSHVTPAGSVDNSAISIATSTQPVSGLTSGQGVLVTLDAWVDSGSWAADPGMFADLSGLVQWVA